MNLPPPLLKIIKDISIDLPEEEQQAFSDAIHAAAEGKDLSVVHWKFLGYELQALPDGLPNRTQNVIDSAIVGMDRLAAGEEWLEAAKVAEDAFALADAADTAVARTAAKTAAFAAAFAATFAAFGDKADKAVAAAAYAANNAAFAAAFAVNGRGCTVSYIKTRRRQHYTLLALINNAKPIRGKIMTDKRGHHLKKEQARNAARIRAIINKNPYVKPKDIIEATGLHPSTVSRHLNLLRELAQQVEGAGE